AAAAVHGGHSGVGAATAEPDQQHSGPVEGGCGEDGVECGGGGVGGDLRRGADDHSGDGGAEGAVAVVPGGAAGVVAAGGPGEATPDFVQSLVERGEVHAGGRVGTGR